MKRIMSGIRSIKDHFDRRRRVRREAKQFDKAMRNVSGSGMSAIAAGLAMQGIARRMEYIPHDIGDVTVPVHGEPGSRGVRRIEMKKRRRRSRRALINKRGWA